MRRAEQQIRDVIQPLDPMRQDERATGVPPEPGPLTSSDDEQSAVRPRPSRGQSRRRVVLAGATAVVLLGSGVMWSSSGPSPSRSYAATPEPLTIVAPQQDQSAAAKLRRIAQRAAASEVPTRATGHTEHIEMKSWYLNSQIGNDNTVSVVQPQMRESWRKPDGSGRSTVTPGTPQFQSQQDRRQWSSDTSTDTRTDQWAPGERDLFADGRPPTGADELRQWLHQHPSGQPEPLRTLTAVTDLLRNRVLLPQERATILRVLAELPGMHYTGTTRDRAGRPGQAFSLESDDSGLPTQYTVIIDPTNGRFLGHETMLTTTAGKLNVKIPAVTSYETYLTKKFTTQS
ncbi:hypothetical protein FHR84_002743 [Actinopolyspora biskrensis]|uniref:CU044_5270 family protein n=1 Tax=Actinopolyspora biskrensis TaxID=1470178 RepID=A0A852Z0V8_9ACTN|nr:CU044_5270 family protein [Actinopolyspora biskrensis]NYH79409.1 hypothetical protein [Actinopolyspora biskrensis]